VRRQAARAVQFIRKLFSSKPPTEPGVDPRDDFEGGLGVREPRRPLHPTLSGTAVLEAPTDEKRDVWAIGDETRG